MYLTCNVDGSIDWNDFANHMMTVAGERDEITTLVDERRRKISYTPHKDMIVYLDYVQKERKYLSISRDGLIGLWSLSMVLHRMTSLSEFLPFFQAWILDAKFMAETSRLIVVTDSRKMCFFDLFSIKPRLLAVISDLDYNPLCLTYTCIT